MASLYGDTNLTNEVIQCHKSILVNHVATKEVQDEILEVLGGIDNVLASVLQQNLLSEEQLQKLKSILTKKQKQSVRIPDLNGLETILDEIDDDTSSTDDEQPSLDSLERIETDYGKDGVEAYEQLQKEMNYFYDGVKTNILHQLSLYLKDKDTSKMCLIDVACGNGNYSRWISENYNFKQILAVDISSFEIQKAIKETDVKKYPNIRYQTADGSTFHTDKEFADLKERFDVAINPWGFGYAESKEALDGFIKSIEFVLKPNAFLIGCTVSIDDVKNLRVGPLGNEPKFLIEVPQKMKCEEGLWIHIVGKAKFRFIEYLYTHQTYHELFKKNGFGSSMFLASCDFIDGRRSTADEQKMLKQLINGKENFMQIFTAYKKSKINVLL